MSRKDDLKACIAAIASDEILRELEARKARIIESSTPVSFGTRCGVRQDLQPLTKHVLAGIDLRIATRTKQIAEDYNLDPKKLNK